MTPMTRKQIARSALLVLTSVALVGCATQPTPHGSDMPGFFMGLLHGFIAPFALIGEIFMDHRVYAFPNSGGWYDFGFLLGVGALTGGGSAASR